MKFFDHKNRIKTLFFSIFCIISLNTTLQTHTAAELPGLPELELFGSHRATKRALNSLLSKNMKNGGATICAEMAHLTDPSTINKLRKFAENKENVVELHLDNKNHLSKQAKSNIEKLRKSGARVALRPHLHSKMWRLELQEQKAVCIKSSNDSNSADRNHEFACISREQEICAAARNFFDNPLETPIKKRKPLPGTPERQRLIHSFETGINDSRTERIQTAIKKKKANPDTPITITMSSMNINDRSLLSALSDAAKAGINTVLYLDGNGITPAKIKTLQPCCDAGVHIFATNPAKRAIMHSKLLLRRMGPDHLLEVSTANATREGDDEQNYSLYIPNTPAHAVAATTAAFVAIQEACLPFDILKEQLLAKHKKSAIEEGTLMEDAPAAKKSKKLHF